MRKTGVRWGGEEHRIHVAPDKVFGVEHGNGSRRYYFFEMDRGTMPVARSDLRRTSLLRKFLSYEATFRDNLHRSLYGLPGFQVLTVTTREGRIGTCVEVLHALQHPRNVAKRFLFMAKSAQSVLFLLLILLLCSATAASFSREQFISCLTFPMQLSGNREILNHSTSSWSFEQASDNEPVNTEEKTSTFPMHWKIVVT